MHLPNNTLLQGGKYKIVRFISSGGFGCTYEAEHILLKKKVAIKEFFVKDFCNRDETTSQISVGITSKTALVNKLKSKFIAEAQSLCSLEHPNIVHVFDVFEENGTAYYVINNNMGYDGDLELAMIPEDFRVSALNETLDDNKVLIEDANSELNRFALLFEFDGDVKHIRHVLYNCSASRPGIEGKTNEESREIQTETLTIKATPLPSGVVKAKTGNETDSTVYADWYKAVYMPTITGVNTGEE